MLTLALTTYNRFELLLESFHMVINDERISEIVILDDCSTDDSYEKLCGVFKDNPKIKLLRNVMNVGMGKNKYEAVKAASNDWVILFDSDNILYPEYLNAFLRLEKRYEDIIYCPEAALPTFYFKEFNGIFICKNNIKEVLAKSMGEVLMNTCNYVVSRAWYLNTYEPSSYHVATDTFWHNQNHLKKDGAFWVVPGMNYFHRVHEHSGFLQEAHDNMRKAKELKNLVMSW